MCDHLGRVREGEEGGEHMCDHLGRVRGGGRRGTYV